MPNTYNAENGVDGAALTTANSGANTISVGANSSLTFAASSARTGTLGYAVRAATTEACLARWLATSATAQVAESPDFRFPAGGNPQNRAFWSVRLAAGPSIRFYYSTTLHQLSWSDAAAANNVVMTETLTEGTWYRLEVRLTQGTSTSGSYTVNVYPAASNTPVNAAPYTSSTYNLVGSSTVTGFAGADMGAQSGGGGVLNVDFDNIRFNPGGATEFGPYVVGQNTAPTVTVDQVSQYAPINSTLSVTATGADPDGTIVSYSWSLSTKPNGAAPAMTGTSAATVGITPTLPGRYVLTGTVTDDQGATASAVATLYVYDPANIDVDTALSVTLNGYAVSAGTVAGVLNDADDTTYLTSADNPTGTSSVDLPLTPVGPGTVSLSFRHRADVSTPARTFTYELRSGTVSVATFGPYTLTTTASTQTVNLSTAQLSAFTPTLRQAPVLRVTAA